MKAVVVVVVSASGMSASAFKTLERSRFLGLISPTSSHPAPAVRFRLGVRVISLSVSESDDPELEDTGRRLLVGVLGQEVVLDEREASVRLAETFLGDSSDGVADDLAVGGRYLDESVELEGLEADDDKGLLLSTGFGEEAEAEDVGGRTTFFTTVFRMMFGLCALAYLSPPGILKKSIISRSGYVDPGFASLLLYRICYRFGFQDGVCGQIEQLNWDEEARFR